MTDPLSQCPTELAADSPYDVLGNRTRLEILLALWVAHEPPGPREGLSFSELYDNVDFDDTGNFSYHLEKLQGDFIKDSIDGYFLTINGLRLVRTFITGELANSTSLDRTPIEECCPICGANLSITYHKQQLIARCDDCPGIRRSPDGEGVVFQCTLPPVGVTGRNPTAVFRRGVTYELHRIESFLRNVCPRCAGDVQLSVSGCFTHDTTTEGLCTECDRINLVDVVGVCRQCKTFGRSPVALAVLANPVVRFRLDADLRSEPFATWSSVHRAFGFAERIEQTEPVHVGVQIPAKEDGMNVIVDESCSVVEIV